MLDYTKKTLMKGRPRLSAADAVDFCLHKLFTDDTKFIGEDVVDGLTFEELIGALLLAMDANRGKTTDVR